MSRLTGKERAVKVGQSSSIGFYKFETGAKSRGSSTGSKIKAQGEPYEIPRPHTDVMASKTSEAKPS